MPMVAPSSYRPPPGLANGHLQTILPTVFRRVREINYRLERITTPDGDFLDLGWSTVGAGRIAVISHGLEGNIDRAYMKGMARALNRAGWDVLAWNFRGCSGEPNRLLRSYHSGATEDLETVLQHLFQNFHYTGVALVGFSMGGNLLLKYLGEQGRGVDRRICGAAAISVPCDLAGSSARISQPGNRIYLRRFLRMLREKIRAKMLLFPGRIDDRNFSAVRTFEDFDNRYTAPLHGFRDAADYYRSCSSLFFLKGIRVPTLLLNAANDPFLTPECFPRKIAADSRHLFLEIPASGGHVGFMLFNREGEFWSEKKTVAFLAHLDDQSQPVRKGAEPADGGRSEAAALAKDSQDINRSSRGTDGRTQGNFSENE